MQEFFLIPTNGKKSFNNKARVQTENGISYLYSYNTKVEHYNHETNKMTVIGWFSSTTATHINAFLNHYGFNNCTKKELLNYNQC